MVRQLERSLLRLLRIKRLQALGDLQVQLRPARGRLPPIQHFTVQNMHELVAAGRGSIREGLGSRRTHLLTPARQRFAQVLKTLHIHVRRCEGAPGRSSDAAIGDVGFDPARLSVVESIAHRLAGNAIDFIAQDRMQFARRALHRHLEFRRIRGGLLGSQFVTQG
jgi:hypothetical protein